ncbi:MAG: RluA family pseudouridine synthase [Planctomycetota bacterium]
MTTIKAVIRSHGDSGDQSSFESGDTDSQSESSQSESSQSESSQSESSQSESSQSESSQSESSQSESSQSESSQIGGSQIGGSQSEDADASDSNASSDPSDIAPLESLVQPTSADDTRGESDVAPVDDDEITSESVYRDFVVPQSADGLRIDLFLTQSCDGYSRSQIRQAVQNEGADLDGRIVRPSVRVRSGQRIRFRVPPLPSDDTIPENIPLDVLFEDDGLVVINKPPGMVVHPARGHWTGTLTSALAYRFQSLSDVGGPTRPGIVHRLDRDTSGVIVIAKTNAVHIHLGAQFHDREVEKEYFAITAGRIDRDRDLIEAPIGRHPYQRDKMAIREGHSTSRHASTFYEVISRHGRFTQVRLLPKTGRTHQLRVHLMHLGCPIICDRLYAGHAEITASELQGGSRATGEEWVLQRQALHARKLTFTNPQSGKRMTFEAPLPSDLQSVVDIL